MSAATSIGESKPAGLFASFGRSVRSLFRGFTVTLHYLFHPSEIVTEEFPDNRDTLVMHDRFRGQVIMPHDAEGNHRCTACTICEKACPNGTISILVTKNEAGQKVLGQYVYRYGQCTLCGLCIESCPFDAIEMGRAIEVATINKDSLVQVLNKREGRA